MEEDKRKLEEIEKRKMEEDRIAAEKELMEQHKKETKLSTGRSMTLSGDNRSGASSQADSESEAERKKRTRPRESPEERKRLKSKKGDEEGSCDDDDGEVEEGDMISVATSILRKMRAFWKQPTIVKMVSKPQTEKFSKYLDTLQEAIMQGRVEKARQEASAEARAEVVDLIRKTMREELNKGDKEEVKSVSYAAAAAKTVPRVPKVTGIKGPVLPAPKVVIVRHEKKESEEVKAILKKSVKPSEIGLKVRRLTNIRNGVVVEAESEEGVENLIHQKSLIEAGLKVERPSKKRPVIMIYDVSADLKEDEIKEEVYVRNLDGRDINIEELDREFVIKHKYKDAKSSGKKVHIVVECSVRVRNLLREREKVFIEWQGCRVKDYVDVARCFKCQRYGHIAKHCSSQKQCCSLCSGEHEYKECPNKNKKEAICCANCKRDGRLDVKHETTSRKCPAYEKAVKRQNEKIDYGL